MTAGAQLYEELLRLLPEGMTPSAWAVKAGLGRTIWSDIKRHGNPSRRTLERLLAAAGSSLAEFEALRVGEPPPAATAVPASAVAGTWSAPWRAAPLAPVPLLKSQAATEWGGGGRGIGLLVIDRTVAIGRVDRPAALAGDPKAYAVTMAGETMWPRFRAGRRLLVSPAAAAAVGDDVLVELDGGRALIGELVRQLEGKVELRQFNPDTKFAVRDADAVSIHKIVGEAL